MVTRVALLVATGAVIWWWIRYEQRGRFDHSDF